MVRVVQYTWTTPGWTFGSAMLTRLGGLVIIQWEGAAAAFHDGAFLTAGRRRYLAALADSMQDQGPDGDRARRAAQAAVRSSEYVP